ncbi:MAG: Asp-tRNA(Asn)/Glu-tRNA(Gln) amidotransferase subunit GatB [Acidimicrobiia bacterium]|nr:Asp-tRNA(Asn)/Glu-tRNA(Gln) amidotransferase subunit GatB [Acidimicrobiia bacterium]
MNWEPVIGIEVHVELKTESKMFCGCRADFGAEPNTNVCPVCLALPGALPVPNEQAIEWIVEIGLALNCTIAEESIFHRKNYFYADLPKNYQISQFDTPVCSNGYLDVEMDGEFTRVAINRVHQEEDTGKSIHVGGGGRIHSAEATHIDFNRAGIPLVEVVTEPDIHSPAQARAYAQQLRSLIESLGVSDAKLEEGSIRFDANVSIRPEGAAELGAKVEIKNMNSFRSLERALDFEIERQTAAVKADQRIVQETRHWDEAAGVTQAMRSKEGSSDYRYFPEPDLVPIVVSDEWREEIRAMLPELPHQRQARYADFGVDAHAASVLVAGEMELSVLFEEAVALGADPKQAANWITGETTAYLRREDKTIKQTGLVAAHLVELAGMLSDGRLSSSAAKEVLAGVLEGEGTPEQVAEKRDLIQMSDTGAIEAAVDSVLEANQEALEKLRSGDMKPFGFLVGQVMRITAGKADPKVVNEILRNRATQ